MAWLNKDKTDIIIPGTWYHINRKCFYFTHPEISS